MTLPWVATLEGRRARVTVLRPCLKRGGARVCVHVCRVILRFCAGVEMSRCVCHSVFVLFCRSRPGAANKRGIKIQLIDCASLFS